MRQQQPSKQQNKTWRAWGDHPVIVSIMLIITFTSTFIVVISFITGKQNLKELISTINNSSSTSQIEDTLKQAAIAIIQSRQTVNEQPLTDIFTGNSLVAQREVLSLLRNTNEYAIWTLHKQVIEDIQINQAGNIATAKQILSWSATIYSKSTQQCVGRFKLYESPQIITLSKTSDKWVILKIDFDNPDPPKVPC